MRPDWLKSIDDAVAGAVETVGFVPAAEALRQWIDVLENRKPLNNLKETSE